MDIGFQHLDDSLDTIGLVRLQSCVRHENLMAGQHHDNFVAVVEYFDVVDQFAVSFMGLQRRLQFVPELPDLLR